VGRLLPSRDSHDPPGSEPPPTQRDRREGPPKRRTSAHHTGEWAPPRDESGWPATALRGARTEAFWENKAHIGDGRCRVKECQVAQGSDANRYNTIGQSAPEVVDRRNRDMRGWKPHGLSSRRRILPSKVMWILEIQSRTRQSADLSKATDWRDPFTSIDAPGERRVQTAASRNSLGLRTWQHLVPAGRQPRQAGKAGV
jgi:hypothetical protein